MTKSGCKHDKDRKVKAVKQAIGKSTPDKPFNVFTLKKSKR